MKKAIFYEAIINYNIYNEDKININDYFMVEDKVNGDYCLIPLNLKEYTYEDIIYEYRYSFNKKTIFKSERINGVWKIVKNHKYYYDSNKFIEKYKLQNIVYLYNLFGLNVDI